MNSSDSKKEVEVVKEDITTVIQSEKRRMTAQDRRLAMLAQKRKKIDEAIKLEKELRANIAKNRIKSESKFFKKLSRGVIDAMGFTEKEKECQADCQFSQLLTEIVDYKLKPLMKVDLLKYECLVPGFEKMAESLGYSKELSSCETKDDYRNIYLKIWNRMDGLLKLEENLKRTD